MTGLLAFAGRPENYIFSIALWLKILSLLLLGVNAVAFYLTDIFGASRESKGREKTRRFAAKLMAASSDCSCGSR